MATKARPARLSRQHEGQARWAYMLAEKHPNDLLYVSGIGWHWYDGARWVEDVDSARAKRLVLELLRTGRSATSVDKDLLREIVACEKASAINGILSLAAALEQFHTPVDQLDADPNALNVANGTLDLLTLELRPHSPADRITKVTRAAFDPNAASERWDRFLRSSLPDRDVRDFLARYVGLALLGRVVEHILVILIGKGRNGKGVFYTTVGFALGDYAGTPSPDLFNRADGTHSAPEMALMGKRWVAVSETGEEATLSVATTKRLVGGDPITARRLYGHEVTFSPSHTAAMITNHLPKVKGDDPAIWERLRVVPFEVVIPESERQKDLPEMLELDADAVLAWALRGLADYRERGGLDAPDAVSAATKRYHRNEDAVTQFVEQTLEKVERGKVVFAVVYLHWQKWAARNQNPDLTKAKFSNALLERGLDVRKGAGNKIYVHGYELAVAP
ncbi:phage/plasmid primase, P4 family [Rhodococcus sp. IEGM 1370]|uniref:DNA primase family protein n=1 Tax=Rhodococcus sp. IEGM 1370 TaxID=3082222 RepID=UPI002953D3BE|nr:phage/plasmid primase, P4 family [Rhodococcus sp. IEGM 1370]MDV8076511.1 phage/plasmid primase, P4 family [Rhodococcus sp. IEGM 1370]